MAQMNAQRTYSASGVMTAVLTPMHEDLRANIPLLAAHCWGLLEAGCSGLLLLGTTGEANSFTTSERRAILQGVLESGIPADRLMVGTGCCATGDTVALTAHALSLGVRRALVLPPFYYKKVSDDGLFDAFAADIEQIADDRLQLFVYLIPQMTGIQIGADLMERLHAAYPKTIAGLKDSSGQWPSTQVLCQRLGAAIDVMVGTEALMLRAMAAGASGCITALGNVAARDIVELYRQRTTPQAAELQASLDAIRASFERESLIPALKARLADACGEPSWRSVRPPLRSL